VKKRLIPAFLAAVVATVITCYIIACTSSKTTIGNISVSLLDHNSVEAANVASRPAEGSSNEEGVVERIARSLHRPIRTLHFSGYEWKVKSSKGRVGPGPNHFSDKNVFVDAQGRLHLRITQRDNRWYCSEVISQRSFGYGTYRFYLDTRVDNLDPNIVLGLFTWSDDPAYSHREIDIECTKWGDANNSTNAQFVVQPYHPPGHLLRFQVPSGTNTSTHSFTWKQDSVFFQSLKGHDATTPEKSDVIKQWTYTQSIPKAGGENARMNLWLVAGRAPTDGKEAEIIIKKFEFVPSP
jgi:hypothetical protein